MPLEHSVAAYRFGHSMVRAQYDHNENFGRNLDGSEKSPPVRATFAQLFQFTGNDVIQGADAQPGEFAFATLPDNWPIRWTRFTDRDLAFPDRFARKIDTHLSPPLTDLSNEGNGPQIQTCASGGSSSASRSAICCAATGSACPTGQAVASALGVKPLTAAELLDGDQGVARCTRRRGLPRRHAAVVLRAQGGRGAGSRASTWARSAAGSCARRSSVRSRPTRLLPQPVRSSLDPGRRGHAPERGRGELDQHIPGVRRRADLTRS